MMIRAHMRCVSEMDVGFFSTRKGFDLRVFLLEPLLHQRLVAFQRMMQRVLTADAELRQKPPNGGNPIQSSRRYVFGDINLFISR
jgi:hypothetical protein